MQTNHRVLAVLLPLTLMACTGEPFTIAPEDAHTMGSSGTAGSSGSAAGSAGTAGTAGDAGSGGTESGKGGSSGTAGMTTAGTAGTSAAGTAGTNQVGGSGGDAGQAGTAGKGGSSSAGNAGTGGDAGKGSSAGSSGTSGSAGTSGTAGAGTGGSSGTSGTGGSGGSPTECTGDILGCFPGDQPKVCSGGKWMLSGGVCNYGCSGGKCACSASGRFTNPSGPTGPFKDAKTALAWATIGSGPQDYATTLAYCTATLSGYRMPTVAEVQSILSQMEPSIFCDPNVDPVILEHLKLQVWSGLPLTSILNADVWTKDTSGGLQRTVNLKTGASGTRDPATKYANVFFCVK